MSEKNLRLTMHRPRRVIFSCMKSMLISQIFMANICISENPQEKTAANSVAKEVTVKNECRCGAANCRKIMFSLPENQVIAPFLKVD